MNERIAVVLGNRWFAPVSAGLVGLGIGALAEHLRNKKQIDNLKATLSEAKKVAELLRDELDDLIQANEAEKIVRQYELAESVEKAEFVARQMTAAGESLRDTVTSLRAREVAGDVDYTKAFRAHPSNLEVNDPSDEVLVDSHESNVVGVDTYQDETRHVIASSPIVDEPEEKANVVSVFDSAGDEWDYATELENRDRTSPYVIHVDEYMADEMGWDAQSTLTWYEADQVLCDTDDKPIYNHDEIVGELRFGHGSNDANCVYIRNERLQQEFEVLRDRGSYEEVVLSDRAHRQIEADELRHSAVRRFRDE